MLDTSDLEAIISDHDGRIRRFGTIDNPDFVATGHNPVCGDRYAVSFRMTGDRIEDVRFEGFGCALSRASSSMMAEELVGRTVAEANDAIDAVHAAIVDGGALPDGVAADLEALLGVRRFPGRIKCVTLAWHAARAALRGQSHATTE
jgi:nitrogen fixation NifU-like protein